MQNIRAGQILDHKQALFPVSAIQHIFLFPVTCFNNNDNSFIYSALFNMLGDQKRITTINTLKTIKKNIRNIQTYLISKRY